MLPKDAQANGLAAAKAGPSRESAPPERIKHPRTVHLPWSRSRSRDDVSADSLDFLNGEIVVTEKLDGENTTIYSDGFSHARSIDSGYHSSRSRVGALAAAISSDIPAGWRVCGENMQARHTLAYEQVPHFLVHSVWNQQNCALSFADTEEFCHQLGLVPVPVLYRGRSSPAELKLLNSNSGAYGPAEGYVVRAAGEIDYQDWSSQVGKYVASGFQIDSGHWIKNWQPNNLLPALERRA